jgi:uncharacterized protein YbjT (DUF2867 family)
MLAKPVIQKLNMAGYDLRLFSRNVTRSMFEKDYEIIRGDVFDHRALRFAINGCDAIHISLSKLNEAVAAKAIVDIALQEKIKLISTVSGCTVAEENRWFPMINNKYLAEQTIINSGIPYMIFRPSWFFETLDLMVRDGKAMLPGKQPNPFHWVAASDYAGMVTAAYKNPDARNKIFFVFGPEQYLMKNLLDEYCKKRYPEIKKVSAVPLWMIKAIAAITGNNELKDASSLFGYFEKVKESDYSAETIRLLDKPATTFENWINTKA